jgi:DNA polymerase I-like protein with 3'-5' exonuclease and polymerase domains
MKYKYINTLPDLPRDKTLYVDTETTTLYGNLVLLQLYQENLEHVFIVDVKRIAPETVLDYLKSFKHIVGYNLQYDWEVLGASFEDVKEQYFYDDLYLASKVVYYWLDSYGLYDVLNSILKLDIKIDKKAMQKQGFGGLFISRAQLEYSATDVYYLPKLYDAILHQQPNFFKTNRVYRQDLFVSKMMLDIHKVGLKVNRQALAQKKQELTAKLKSFNFPFNPLSPQQVAQVLGTEKADKETLLDLVYKGDELAKQIYEYRKITKLLNFIDKFSVDRVFGKFNVVGAKSGRMTCSSENIQQIPRELRSVFGFTEDEGKVYVVADFPQIELRLAGLIWQEKNMIDAFVNDIDLHKYTASVIYGKSMTDVSKSERQIAKSANFGLLYGMSGKAFANYVYTNTGIRLSEHEGEAIKRKWLATYPTIAKKHQRVKDVLYAKNVYEDKTILGRPYRTQSFNEALNIQIQGSGAELLKQTVINIKRKAPSLQIANLIHDEIIIECDKSEAQDVADFLQSEMELAWQDLCKNAKLDIEKFDLKVEKPDIILSIAKS